MASATSELILPPRIGKYLPIRRIGEGGMSVVYEVEHAHTGERWALKLLRGAVALDGKGLERFRREARISARLRSPNVVRVIDADVAPELGGMPYIVMDLLEGATLAKIAGREPQPAARVIEWLRPVARVLDRAHELGIIHRDIKPENIFLARDDSGSAVVKILDFGVAKVRADPEASARTATGAVVGTPLYMSPEQASGESSAIGPWSDVWSIGMVAHRLLTGRDYWDAPSVSHLFAQLVYSPMEPPSKRTPSWGPELDAWFLRSCAREPQARFQSVREQIEALADACGVPREQQAEPVALGTTLPEVDGPPSGRRARAATPRSDPTDSHERRDKAGWRTAVVAAGSISAAAVSAILLFAPQRPNGTSGVASVAASDTPAVASTAGESPKTPDSSSAAASVTGTNEPPPRGSASARPTAEASVKVPSRASAATASAPPSSSSRPPVRDPLADPH